MLDLDRVARESADAVRGTAPPMSQLIERARSRHRRRAAVRGFAIAAFAAVVLTGAMAISRSTSSTLDLTDGSARDDDNSVVKHDPLTEVPEEWNVVVFFSADASDAEIDGVQVTLDGSEDVDETMFMSKQATFAEFEAYFAGDQRLLDTITLETMPPSIRVKTTDSDLDAPVFAVVAEQAGVRTIVSSTGQIPKPITTYGSPTFDRRGRASLYALSRAGFEEAFVRCMADKGFVSIEPIDIASLFSRQYLEDLGELDDPGYAERWGFALFTTDGEAQPEQGGVLLDEDNPYYKAAFGGFFGGGCWSDAGGWMSGENDVNKEWEKVEAAHVAFAQDERVIDHYQTWSDCMREEGFDATSPLDAYYSVIDGRVSEVDEIPLAVATVECGGSSSNLVSLRLAPVWDEYADGDWSKNRYPALRDDCLGPAALDSIDLGVFFNQDELSPAWLGEFFPESCFD